MKYFRAIKGAAVSQLGNCEMAALLEYLYEIFPYTCYNIL